MLHCKVMSQLLRLQSSRADQRLLRRSTHMPRSHMQPLNHMSIQLHTSLKGQLLLLLRDSEGRVQFSGSRGSQSCSLANQAMQEWLRSLIPRRLARFNTRAMMGRGRPDRIGPCNSCLRFTKISISFCSLLFPSSCGCAQELPARGT